jgi:lipoprotein NlpD
VLSFVAAAATLGGCSIAPWRTPPAGIGDPGYVTANTTPPVAAGFYRVNAGDTLASIATAFGRAPSSVAGWNRLSIADPVFPGQMLRVAPPLTGVLSSGLSTTRTSDNIGRADAMRFEWPVHGPVTTTFGSDGSKGIKIGGTAGDPVKAAQGGRVVYAGGRIKAYGLLMIIKHDAHFLTAYGNNRKLLVKEGAAVTRGQTIAEMGSDNKGPASVTFEVREDGRPVDPVDYLPKHPG